MVFNEISFPPSFSKNFFKPCTEESNAERYCADVCLKDAISLFEESFISVACEELVSKKPLKSAIMFSAYDFWEI
jgi:hypothetical protein